MIIKDNLTGDVLEQRKHAEKIAREKEAQSPEDIESLSPEEIRQMLHELRVHQIELEMQNEELRMAQAELDAARARYFDLYDLAPVGYFTVSDKGLILEANLTAATQLGCTRNTLVKMPITRFILKEDQDIYYRYRKRLVKTGMPQECDLRMLEKDGTMHWAHLAATVVQDVDGAPVGRIVMSDITERKRAEDALRESEDRFRKLFESHSAPKLVIDPETGAIIDANEASAKFYGWPLEELKQMRIQQISIRSPEDVMAGLKKIVSQESARLEFCHRRADGSIRDVEVFCNKIEIAGKTPLYAIIHDITERKQAEENLKASETRYRDLAEFIPAMVWSTDTQGLAISQYSRWYEYTGQTPEESSGNGWMKVVHPDDLQQVIDRWNQSIRTGDNYSVEYRIRRASDGVYRWHSIQGILRKDQHGNPLIWFGTCIDIEDNKRAEAALQESEMRFRTMANAMPQLAWIARADGHIFWYNQRWYDYTGTVPEQMEGWGWQSVHAPNVLPKVLERWQASLSTSEPFDMAFPLRGADGIFRPFLTRVIPLKDNDGRVQQWFGTNTDISELKRIEQALRESEALYRSIGESIDYGVWICAPDGRNTYASESFLKMVGITQEQCSNFGWGNVLHPDDAERTISLWQECVRTGGKWDIEHRFRGTDGQWHPVLARGVPVRNEQGEIISWAGINLDIRRIKQAEDQLRASLAEKEVLLKEIHHRVKNNLQVISSLISLQADGLADEQMQGVLGDVRNRVRTMSLVHEKLYQTEDLARLDFAEYALSLLNYIWDSHNASNSNVSLNMSLSPLILPVGTAVLCGLILNELASNAIKHAFPDGRGGEVTVTLVHNPDSGAVSLQVRDDGVGLPADLDWRQTNSLGLRLVQMLAKQMRGTVETGPGPGTEFQINFNVKEIPS